MSDSEQSTAPGVPAALRTIVYLLGALGVVILFVGGLPPEVETGSKIAAGLAAVFGFTYNPSFGIGSKR